MIRASWIIGLTTFVAPICIADGPTTLPGTNPSTQQLCLRETDPASPRKSKLRSSKPDDEVLHLSLQGKDHPDVLERWWNSHRCRWIDESDNMKATDARGDLAGDSLQIDADGDGYYDGPGDWNIKWVDDDNDGVADAQIVAINPRADQVGFTHGSSHYMIFIDQDHDGVNAFIDWENLDWETAKAGNWHLNGTNNYSPDYNGNSIFLKQHEPAWSSKDPRFNWENPFAFYDTDNDGCTEMTIRLLDHPSGSSLERTYTGKCNDAYISYDLDNDSQKGNEFDLDMTLRFASSDQQAQIDYTGFHNRHAIRAPKWVLDAKLFRYDNYRRIDEWCFVPFEKCYDTVFANKWGQCWLTFDEDDDDHRWERVELYYPNRDVYSTKRVRGGKPKPDTSIAGHVQADGLGDRGEWDLDNSGGGKLYVGSWDGKLHLFGAESGAWLVDEHARYWGAGPVTPGGSSKENPTKVEAVVQYKDTDGNGYLDEITWDDDGDGKVDLTISLLNDKDAEHPHPDEARLYDPAKLQWQGMHELYQKICEDNFRGGMAVYRSAWRKGLTTPELDALAVASSTAEKYDHGYWLKQKIFRLVDQKLTGDKQQESLRHAFALGDIKAMCAIIESLR